MSLQSCVNVVNLENIDEYHNWITSTLLMISDEWSSRHTAEYYSTTNAKCHKAHSILIFANHAFNRTATLSGRALRLHQPLLLKSTQWMACCGTILLPSSTTAEIWRKHVCSLLLKICLTVVFKMIHFPISESSDVCFIILFRYSQARGTCGDADSWFDSCITSPLIISHVDHIIFSINSFMIVIVVFSWMCSFHRLIVEC